VAELIPVQSADFPARFDEVREYLQSMADRSHGRMSLQTISESIALRKRQLWIAVDGDDVLAAAVTEILICETGMKICNMVGGSGKRFREWVDMRKELELWAKDAGCQRIQARLRKGWTRFFDWPMTHVFIEKGL